MKHWNLARGTALGATILFAACSGTSNAPSTPATHPPLGDQGAAQIVVANDSRVEIAPDEVDAAPCWEIDPPFPTVARDTKSQPVKLADNSCSSQDSLLEVLYDGESGACGFEVMAVVEDGRRVHYAYSVVQASDTKCTVSTTSSGALFTFALKS